MKRLSLVILLALSLSACASSAKGASPTSTAPAASTTSTQPGPTPFQVLSAETDALNRGDVAGSVAYFAPDAVLITPLGGCNPCTGREAIREHWSSAAAGQTMIELSDPQTVGDIVTVQSTTRSPQLPTGITRVLGTAVVSVRDGKITRLDQRYDEHDAQTAALLAFAAGARPPTTTPTP
jgi:hypothetical protein